MKRIRYLALIAGMAAALMAAPAFAAGDDYVVDPGHPGSITINYRDSIDGDDPVAGAEFTYYRVTAFDSAMSRSNVGLAFPTLLKDKKGNPIVVSSRSDPEKVRKKVQAAYEKGTPEGGVIYKAVTDSSGRAVTEGMAQGIYLAVETKAAKEHLASSPFFVVLPYTHDNKWNYDITADPKPIPCGDLVITKKVQGNQAETDREFHFKVTINADGSFHYRKSDGKEGKMKSGKMFTLKSGESVTIDTIPVGTSYKVKEIEANNDGYTTTAKGTKGKIKRKEQAVAAFVNSKEPPTGTPPDEDNPGKPGEPEEESQTGSTIRTAPIKTGDTTNVIIWLVLAAVALVILYLAIIPGRKTKEDRK